MSWLPFALGGYAAATVLLPYPASAVMGAVPLVLTGGWFLLVRPHLWLLLFLCFAMLLPPLPIAVGDSGPHASFALAAVGGLLGLSQLDRWRMPRDGPALAMAALGAAMLVSLLPAALYSGTSIALASLARVFLFGISIFVYWYLTDGPGEASFGWTRTLFAAGTVSAAVAILDFYFQLVPGNGFAQQFVWLDSGVFRRAQGMFYEASALGNFCVFFLVMIAAGFVHGPISRVWLGAGACLFAAALVFSYSRGSIVNLAVALLALGYLRRRAFPIRALIILGVIVACAVAVLYELRPEFLALYSRRLSGSVTSFWDAPEGVLSGRVSNWETLLSFAMQNPQHLFFGVGYKTLAYTSVVADNAYLSALIETGIGGLAALVALNVSILRTTWRAAHGPDSRAAFFGTWMFCFWAGQSIQMLSADLLTYWRLLPLYFWALAMARSSVRK